MTDLGVISHYLEMQVNHIIGKKITLCPSTYLKKIFDRFKMTEYKSASIPINLGVVNSLLPYDRNAVKEIIKWYQSAIESLIWLVVYTRPDIAYLVEILNC